VAFRAAFDRRVRAALDAAPPRIPVVLGPSGAGRTALLQRLHVQLGRQASQYIDVQRVATTPERFFLAVSDHSPFAHATNGRALDSPRAAFDLTLAFFQNARSGSGGRATFLLDEIFEIRTFESFPGLKHAFVDLLAALGAGGNRFVLASQYESRAHRALRHAPAAFDVIHLEPLTVEEVRDLVAARLAGDAPEAQDETARLVHTLAAGRPVYAVALADGCAALGPGGDPIAALAAQMGPSGELYGCCRFCYEMRLQQARGYGALKAILDILAGEEPLTLTHISRKLRRTPGSTKDYLSWLEDVDLVAVRDKRYRFADPMLRLWVRIHCRPTPPDEEHVAREVRAYALERLPQAAAPAAEPAGPGVADRARRGSGIIEID
jgi:hypothetical protein